MLHLLPIRILMTCFAVAMAFMILGAFYVGHLQTAEAAQSAFKVIRWASLLSLAAIVGCAAAWRGIPVIQSMIFPYLGGTWEGEVRYLDSNNLSCLKPVTMDVKHTLTAIKLVLDSDESTSATLATHAEKDPDFDRYRIFYVYLNQRKEGAAGGGGAYRGLAVARWTAGAQPLLEGDYFTETHRQGTLHLRRTMKTPFWKLWR